MGVGKSMRPQIHFLTWKPVRVSVSPCGFVGLSGVEIGPSFAGTVLLPPKEEAPSERNMKVVLGKGGAGAWVVP